MFSIDYETYPIQPGVPYPPPVCLQVYDHETGWSTIYHVNGGPCLGVKMHPGTFEPDYSTLRVGDAVTLDQALQYVLVSALDSGRKIVAHHVGFELAVSLQRPGCQDLVFRLLDQGQFYCTALGDTLEKIETGEHEFCLVGGQLVRTKHSMDAVVTREFGVDLSAKTSADSWRVKYGTLLGLDVPDWPEDAQKYALEDPVWAGAIYQRQIDRGSKNLDDMPQQCNSALDLALVTSWGFRTDPKAVKFLKTKIEQEVKVLTKLLQEMGVLRKSGARNMAKIRSLVWIAYDGNPPLTDSGQDLLDEGKVQYPPEDLVEEAFNQMWGKNVDLFKLGADDPRIARWAQGLDEDKNALNTRYINPFKHTSTAADTTLESGHPDLIQYSETYRYKTLQTSFLPKLEIGLERPIQPSFSILKATGRTSSWGDLNVQNQPRMQGLRECIVPRPGYLFIAADYDSIELRAFAQICFDLIGFSVLGDRYKANPDFDPHTYLASVMMGISFEEGLRLKALGDAELKSNRTLAKVPNYTYIGGGGPRSLISVAAGYGITLTYEASARYKEFFLEAWPEAAIYLQYISSMLSYDNLGTFRLPRSGRARRGTYCQLANYGFQGPAADGWKKAMSRVTREGFGYGSDTALRGSRIIAPVHDELVLEIPEDQALAGASRLAEVMVEEMAREIPDVPIRASGHAMDRWYKDAGGPGVYSKTYKEIYG